MSRAINNVGDYFDLPAQSHWSWQDDGHVVTWPGGETIAFRGELVAVLERLRSHCLPPLGAVVLLLAACRDSWSEPLNKVALLLGVLHSGGRKDRDELLHRVAGHLDRVHALDRELRNSTAAKAELAAMVFEGQGDGLSHRHERIIAALVDGEINAPRARHRAVDLLLRDLAWLDRGLPRVAEAALRMRLRTGLEQPIKPAPVEVPNVGSARQLIADLKTDEQLGGVARLAQLLLAAVNLPRPLSHPEDLLVGGISDISNRGSLDRLLLSELANDGLTLAVRVAMNEALYLRRETPPRTPTRRRLVMLDSGLRMWGVPRVFAAAVGLAVAAGTEPGWDVDVFRAAGDRLAPIDMTTAAGLTEHLATLDHRVHPGEALDDLWTRAEQADDATDVIVVTTDDVLADREFQRALERTDLDELFIASVSRDGAFRLEQRTRRGRKTLREAQLNLEEILTPAKKPTQPLVDDKSFQLPAIFRAQPFPLLLSTQVDIERSWYVDGLGALSYTRDGRILLWERQGWGARQIDEALPAGNLHWASTTHINGTVLAIVGKLSARGLYALHIDAHASTVRRVQLQVTVEQPTIVFVHSGVAFVGDANAISAYSVSTGQPLASLQLDGLHYRHHRFFTRFEKTTPNRKWVALWFNGTEIVAQSVFREANSLQVPAIIETPSNGMVAITTDGDVRLTYNMQKLEISGARSPKNSILHKSSRNGLRVVLADCARHTYELLDLVGEKARAIGSSVIDRELEPALFKLARPNVLRHRFNAVGVDEQGRIVLLGRRDTMWPLAASQKTGKLSLPSHPGPVTLRVRRQFALVDSLQPNPYSLAVAQFFDGSRVVLDERGLLHLKSSDPELPEITLTLNEGEIAGWMSDGRCWGPEYFLGAQIPTADLQPIDVLTRFAERLT